jgi:hypothetical protein
MKVKVEIEIETESFDEETFANKIEELITSPGYKGGGFSKGSKLIKFDMFIMEEK